MHIPERVIEDIRNSADIVDIVSDYVPLKKRGKNFLGLCPFHHEKTPSFVVSEDKQIFHCFGCHKGGNVFTFMMEHHKLSFVEAAQELAQKLGIQIDYEEDKGHQDENEIFYEINLQAAKYFTSNIIDPNIGGSARSYLTGRGISVKTMREFGIGYAIPSRDALINHFTGQSISIDKAIELGLIGRSSNDNRLYDRFAGRLIFPVLSPNGRVVAFGGRIMEKNDKASKYINSPESPIYTKGKVLYGLSFAKDQIRTEDYTILVEGYLDVISLHQNEIKNTVAVSGTALTEDQIQLLSRYSKNVVLFFDADEAGIKASMRSIELLLKRNFDIRVASLPDKEDPDSYVKQYGKEGFLNFVKSSKNFLEYQTQFYHNNGWFDDPIKTAHAIREIVKPLVFLEDQLKRTLLIRSLAEKFNLREILLENELNKELEKYNAKLSQTNVNVNVSSVSLQRGSQQLSGAKKEDVKTSLHYLKRERELLKLLYDGKPEILKLIFQFISPVDISLAKHRELFEQIKEEYEEKGEIDTAMLIENYRNEETKAYISEICLEKYFTSKRWEENAGMEARDNSVRFAKDIIKKIKVEQINKEIRSNNSAMNDAGSAEEQIEIAQKNMQLNKRIQEIISTLT
ncbi:MAG: DNA primase [Bacteroidota bacterium]|nr:DNA primase [Bacteroidota bacterium]